MQWYELVFRNGVVFAIIAGIYKKLSSDSITKQINNGLSKLDLLTEAQLTDVLQKNIKIHDERLFAQQAMTTNNISHMRQAWINDLRLNVANFLHKAQWIRVEITRIYEAMLNQEKIMAVPESKQTPLDANTLKNIPEFIQESQKKVGNSIQELGLIYSYVDLLLPFSDEKFNKKEPDADNLRSLLGQIMDEYYAISGSSDLLIIQEKLNKILKCINFSREKIKIILLTEWRATREMKFFKELEPDNNKPSTDISEV
ncbi:hypothetical protein MNY64_14380 [Moellerella wisconsensis]|uniref:hypothetical protein n=1 Tax=Moellerella wisconsensis TaxID=158849 RepID=UPI001F4DA8FB|nr:hypothetical protein [Moellerella wisconsensis]UNH27005.1 hypothetical protein MNY64_14380 [Moellerella wisconsensis]